MSRARAQARPHRDGRGGERAARRLTKGTASTARKLARPFAARVARKPSGPLRTDMECTGAEPLEQARGLRSGTGVGAKPLMSAAVRRARQHPAARSFRGCLGSATARSWQRYIPVQTLQARAKHKARARGSGAACSTQAAPRRDGRSGPLARAALSAAASMEETWVVWATWKRLYRSLFTSGQLARERGRAALGRRPHTFVDSAFFWTLVMTSPVLLSVDERERVASVYTAGVPACCAGL